MDQLVANIRSQPNDGILCDPLCVPVSVQIMHADSAIRHAAGLIVHPEPDRAGEANAPPTGTNTIATRAVPQTPRSLQQQENP